MRFRFASAGAAVAAGAVLSPSLLVVLSGYPVIAIAGAGAAALLGAGLGVAADRWHPSANRAGGLAVDGLLVAWLVAALAYLSVPDTEGAVLVGSYLSVVGGAWYLARWPTDGAGAGAAVTGATAAAVAATVVGASESFTPGGWWVAKIVAVVAVAGAVVATHRRFSPSGQGRPSP